MIKDTNNVVLVTHGMVCKLAVLHFLHIPNSHFWDMRFDAGSITLLEKRDGRVTVCFVNETCHLEEIPGGKGLRNPFHAKPIGKQVCHYDNR